jgi:hypothetical protein
LNKVWALIIILAVCSIVQAQNSSSLILSEVMFNPSAGNNEYVEIFNKSYTQSFNLNGYRVQYYNNSQDTIASFGSGTVLKPRSYAVIFENDYDLQNGIYRNKIPAQALVLRITHNVFGLSGMSNTTDRPVRLLNTQNDTLSTYTYHADNDSGYSDEKMYLEGDSTVWGNSLVLNGTPGGVNSNSRLLYDLKVSSISINPETPRPFSYLQITAVIKNCGIKAAGNYSVEIYDDKNLDSIPSGNELLASREYMNLIAGDSLVLNNQMYLPEDRNYNLIVKAKYSADQDTANNIYYLPFHTSTLSNNQCVVINEIMYAPSGTEPEWIEIFNRKDYAINLKGWKISDGTVNAVISESDMIINPKSYFVLCKDSLLKNYYNYNIPLKIVNLYSLNNSGDRIILKDAGNYTVDSVYYKSSWGGSGGKSLERKYADSLSGNPSNWGTSVSGKNGTPGIVNSITPKNYDLAVNGFYFTNGFVVTGDAAKGRTEIFNKGMNLAAGYNLNIYYDGNRDSIAQPGEKIITLQGVPVISGESKSFDFSINNYQEGLNYYIAKIDFEYDADTTNNTGYAKLTAVKPEFDRNDLAVNEIMYNPGSEEKSEWVEIYNKSSRNINLKGLKIADSRDTMTVVNNSIELAPASYFVIARDSSFLRQYQIPNVTVGNFPQLNNDYDKVIIIDSLNRTIDSVSYKSSWGGNAGYSLERYSFDSPPNDSVNWKTSKYAGGTPGGKNSVMQKDFDAGVSSFNYAVKDSAVLLSAVIKNYGRNRIDFTVKIYEDNNLDSLEDIEAASFNKGVNAGDSAVINYSSPVPPAKRGYLVKIISSADEDSLNNKKYLIVNPALKYNALVINEIMFAPLYGRPEWIELYNNSRDTLALKGIAITDRAYNSCTLNGGALLPGCYMVVTKDTAILKYYPLPKEKIIIADLPLLNNDEESLELRDNYGHLIDSVYYKFQRDTINGRSLEKIEPAMDGSRQNSWALSQSVNKGTPANINSVSKKDYDVELTKLNWQPAEPQINAAVTLTADISNKGKNKAAGFEIRFYIDMNNDSIPETLLDSQTISLLDTSAGITVKSSKSFVLSGAIKAKAEISYIRDEYNDNNCAEVLIVPAGGAGSVLINEIMCNPQTGSPKWIELFFKQPADINGWSLTINSNKYNIPPAEYSFPNGYCVLAGDTSFAGIFPSVQNVIYIPLTGLTREGAKIVLTDKYGRVIDSVSYTEKEAKYKGWSIERNISNGQWHSCIGKSKSTPGALNSISAAVFKESRLAVNEIMFEPGSDNNQFVEIYNARDDSVNLAHYSMVSGNFEVPVRLTEMYLPPNKYYILSADTLLYAKYNLDDYLYKSEREIEFELPKSEGFIVLKNLEGTVADSVYYSKSFHKKNISTKNRSLERIKPTIKAIDYSNWSSSASPEGGTPGRVNSINMESKVFNGKINISPNPFSPDNDGYEDFTEISYDLSNPAANIVLRIFDNTGRIVRTINTGRPSPAQGSIIYDGLDDNGKPLRIGIYILLLEASGNNGSGSEVIKTVFVAARKL